MGLVYLRTPQAAISTVPGESAEVALRTQKRNEMPAVLQPSGQQMLRRIETMSQSTQCTRVAQNQHAEYLVNLLFRTILIREARRYAGDLLESVRYCAALNFPTKGRLGPDATRRLASRNPYSPLSAAVREITVKICFIKNIRDLLIWPK